MVRRVFLVAFLVALATSLVAPLAVSAAGPVAPVESGVKSRATLQCVIAFTAWQKRDADAVVKSVKSEAVVNAPEDASTALTNGIKRFYRDGCGGALDLYVRVRVSAPAYGWYLAVLEDLGY